MAPNDFRRDIEDMQNRIERLSSEPAEIHAKVAETVVELSDREVCVFDKSLISQFHLLDRGASDEPCTPPVFMAFDCLQVHGLDVRGLPLHRRRAMLDQEVAGARMVFGARRLPDNGLDA